MREESNIFCNVPISIITAIIGGEIEVPTIDGKRAKLKIPPGTQAVQQFRLTGKGMSVLRQNRRGDMYVETNVEIPVNLTSKQKAILKEFGDSGAMSKDHSPKRHGFFNKIKQARDDLA